MPTQSIAHTITVLVALLQTLKLEPGLDGPMGIVKPGSRAGGSKGIMQAGHERPVFVGRAEGLIAHPKPNGFEFQDPAPVVMKLDG